MFHSAATTEKEHIRELLRSGLHTWTAS